jgi:hypothetical protein
LEYFSSCDVNSMFSFIDGLFSGLLHRFNRVRKIHFFAPNSNIQIYLTGYSSILLNDFMNQNQAAPAPVAPASTVPISPARSPRSKSPAPVPQGDYIPPIRSYDAPSADVRFFIFIMLAHVLSTQ